MNIEDLKNISEQFNAIKINNIKYVVRIVEKSQFRYPQKYNHSTFYIIDTIEDETLDEFKKRWLIEQIKKNN